MEVSFEFFPPQTPRGRDNLVRTAERLANFAPVFYSVTYGAGGSTRDRTFDAVAALREAGINAAPHLSWGDDDVLDVLSSINAYRQLGVDRFVALMGDTSRSDSPTPRHHAEDLVTLIRERIDSPLDIHVAAYPEVHPIAPSPDADIDFLKRKIDAGATGCITQYFYNCDSYFFFLERCRSAGITVPIVPGVMPITNYESLIRFSNRAGAEIPRWIEKRLEYLAEDEAALCAFGEDVVVTLCQRLIDGGAPGIHFYTLNKAGPTEAIAQHLSLEPTP